MHVSVNGVRLFFDVEGAKFVPDGPVMREKPVLLMLHGGPGADHSIYRPAYSALADIAQIVYLDHRGNGRSEDGPRGGLESGAVGRRRARVLRGARHRRSDRAGRLVRRHGRAGLRHAPPGPPVETDPDQHRSRGRLDYLERRVELFERFGGPEVGALARRRFLEARGPSGPGLASRPGGGWRCRIYFAHPARSGHGAPRRQPAGGGCSGSPDRAARATRFNMFPDLHRIQCPTLVLGGEDDPMHPIESQADIAAALPPHLVQFERFADCRHAVMPDAPERTMACSGIHPER